MGGACSKYGRDKKYIQNFNQKLAMKKSHERTRRTWKDNTKTDLK
jgi:hypothetical protein